MHRVTVTPPIPIDVEAVTAKFETSTLTATDLLVAGIAIVAGFVLGAITRKAVARLIATVPGVRPTTGSILARLAGYVVVVFGFVIAFSALGLSFGPVITLLLMIALIAVLIGRPMLADLGAGVVLQARQPVQIGDVVQVCGGREGVVTEIDGRVVHVRTFDGWMVRMRNSQFMDDPIVSAARPDRIRVEFVIGLDYSTDLDRAVALTAETLAGVDGVLASPGPQVLIDEFGDSTINAKVWIWTDPITRWSVKDRAMRAVKRDLDANGIVIAFPQRVLHTAP
ncbi:small-conductance mechanosensitive channel [Ilumatobacter fluminis]|uniref:Small-conductance mechanosensitive channel n=1 Tax=Ilumatobacter fluminis TaxID=467091 RepID=A0A4R7HWY3_9ACTN|nr:mechanosensitive ion channel family protein [Ilumatobacter fluminis]TDT15647.1 small-conductance mechanosensitive channel [Ilumatobacter fluminis]